MIAQLINYIIHIDAYLVSFVTTYGNFTYFLLFAIIFSETGLLVTAFLPGDSLLFAAGSIAAQPTNPLNIQLLFILLLVASIFGNKLNYSIGRLLGPKVFKAESSWFFNKKHLERTYHFYEKHGGKTIILARFIPIIRTFAPFVAGVGAMQLRTFSLYNIISAFLWIGSLLGAGYLFGNLPLIKNNFSLVIYSIIFISFLPVLFSVIFKRNLA